MAIYIGSKQLVRRFIGAQEVLRSYVGDQLVWTKPAQYPASGSWAGGAVPAGDVIQTSHTITGDGSYTITWSVNYTAATNGTLAGARWRVNGTGTWTGGAYLNFPGTSTATGTRTLVAGDVVQFYTSAEKNDAVASGGTWTITKN